MHGTYNVKLEKCILYDIMSYHNLQGRMQMACFISDEVCWSSSWVFQCLRFVWVLGLMQCIYPNIRQPINTIYSFHENAYILSMFLCRLVFTCIICWNQIMIRIKLLEYYCNKKVHISVRQLVTSNCIISRRTSS